MAEKDIFGRYLPYRSPDITGYEDTVKQLVYGFANYVLNDKSDEEKRTLLNQVPNATGLIVVFVNDNKPEAMPRVDGRVIQPIIREVASEILATIPLPEQNTPEEL